VESHTNVAKGATLGWGIRRLASAAKADGGDGPYGTAKAVPFQKISAPKGASDFRGLRHR